MLERISMSSMEYMSYQKRLWLLFATFFKIALFVVGGGLAMLPVIEEQFVHKHKLITKEDMLDMVVLTQTIPGLIAVNSATFIGNKIAGLLGAIVATVAVIIPSLVILTLIAIFFKNPDFKNPVLLQAFNCVRACITGVFVVTAVRLAYSVLKTKGCIVLAGSYLIALLYGINPIYVVLASMPIGCFLLWREKKSSFKIKNQKTNLLKQ